MGSRTSVRSPLAHSLIACSLALMFICPIVCQTNMFASGSPSLWLVWATRNAYALRSRSAWSRTTGSSAHPRGSQGLPTLPRLALITESLASKGVVRRLPPAVRLLATRYWLGQYGRGEVLQYARRLALHNTDAWHGVQSRKYGAWVTGTHAKHECWSRWIGIGRTTGLMLAHASQGMEQE